MLRGPAVRLTSDFILTLFSCFIVVPTEAQKPYEVYEDNAHVSNVTNVTRGRLIAAFMRRKVSKELFSRRPL